MSIQTNPSPPPKTPAPSHESPTRHVLNPIIIARENAANGTRRIAVHDTLHRDVRADSEKEESDANNEDIDSQHKVSPDTLLVQPPHTPVNATHTDVRHAPEDESEERVEERGHQTQQVGEERDDLGDDEGAEPGQGEDTGPRAPADDSVRGLVDGALENAEEDEAGGDGGVEDTEEDEGGDHEGEGHLLEDLVAQGPEGGGSHVLVTGVDRLGEVLWLAHLGDEAGKGDLADEGVGDVKEGAHGSDEGGAGEREGGVGWRAELLCEAERLVFYAGEDGGEKDGDESEECGCAGDLGERVEGARERAEPANDGGDDRENDGRGGPG
ncbi:hypothetical protein V496_00591 [Pseudogymnoascus sp. VKM F-4515 (FW-2607)]|nr:hypothetical protein V496_00591 [Pseudogymnoascus sp. VKM F-4515 (FW-2607)]